MSFYRSDRSSSFVQNNPNELDLLNWKKNHRSTAITQSQLFQQIHPNVQNLAILFDNLCPNFYRVHCSDSLRILKEIIALTDEYLHVQPALIVSSTELLYSEDHLNDYMDKMRLSSIYPSKSINSNRPNLRFFGQGIQACNYYNELHQTLIFCFEVNMKDSSFDQRYLPFEIQIADPDGYPVPVDIRHINTYINEQSTNLFSCSYTPISKAGIYKVSFLYKNMKIAHHPYTVSIRDSPLKKVSHRDKEEFNNESIFKSKQQGKCE